ncbi:predicted protein [Chaetomium globosum CBS 148.51]|uniref:Uncharacterized protein n=1 Tax=Chaetomium globosum (strain ATCC 6205 / CBS 148.51 / DSM 1962 / NBRC 6347 / NRRL 1970) TaxID=306901 RepID=Q2HC08_CHAGB|nr:uncharacterized protein CHGG_02246 [Chaetomium globosum CBS 148.51]EAQ90311.1 predicted protein [Chaetomium globosum CBS 148.51]
MGERQQQTAQQPNPYSPLGQPGPHGYPMRFGVRLAGLKGFKIYGADPKQPYRYVELHTRRQILHESAHKKDCSPALVTVKENWPSWSLFPLDDESATFTITVHSNSKEANTDPDDNTTAEPEAAADSEASSPGPPNTEATNTEATNTEIINTEAADMEAADAEASEPEAVDLTIDMDHTRCRPVTFQFTFPVPSPQADGTTTLETFEWRRAPQACQETRGIRKRTLPPLETGDDRLPEEKFVYAPSGSVLVRLGEGSNRCAPGRDRPLGFTRAGEEIVASYTASRDYRAWYYFQFWGSGATGELGEAFTHVAVMSGLAVYQDEEAERAKRAKRKTDVHGARPPVSTGLP